MKPILHDETYYLQSELLILCESIVTIQSKVGGPIGLDHHHYTTTNIPVQWSQIPDWHGQVTTAKLPPPLMIFGILHRNANEYCSFWVTSFLDGKLH